MLRQCRALPLSPFDYLYYPLVTNTCDRGFTLGKKGWIEACTCKHIWLVEEGSSTWSWKDKHQSPTWIALPRNWSYFDSTKLIPTEFAMRSNILEVCRQLLLLYLQQVLVLSQLSLHLLMQDEEYLHLNFISKNNNISSNSTFSKTPPHWMSSISIFKKLQGLTRPVDRQMYVFQICTIWLTHWKTPFSEELLKLWWYQ